jgi:hypothetical protein
MDHVARWKPFLGSAELRQIRRAGRVGDWLHNLAVFSILDFVGFGEAWFWRDYEALVRDFGSDVAHYRAVFDRELVDPTIKIVAASQATASGGSSS